MSGFKDVTINPGTISLDAGGRTRVSQMTTLFDGKILNSDNPFVFDTQGTGIGLWGENKYNMSVTGSTYLVRQTKRFAPYSSGKSQIMEMTFDNFQLETNVNKKVGYFSSSATAPFTGSTDGFYLENDGTQYILKADRLGVNTINVPWTSWDNYAIISGYNWSNFTVIAFDFLWLGGAVLRLFLKTNQGFVLCHTYNYAGSSSDTFISSPNQPIRYSIRSTGATGSLRYVCSQVSTEGSIDEAGYNNSVDSLNTATVASNTVATIGTTYPLLAIRKKTTNRDNSVKITGAQVMVSSAADFVYWSINLNPTLSAPLTYTAITNSSIEYAYGSAVAAISTTVTNPGRMIAGGIINLNGVMPSSLFENDFLTYLGGTIDNVMDQLVLCVTPITAGVTLNGTINFKEY